MASDWIMKVFSQVGRKESFVAFIFSLFLVNMWFITA